LTLDALGDAIGSLAITPDEIDALMAALEAQGRRLLGPEGGGGEQRLGRVIAAARALTSETGRRPGVAEVAERSGLTPEQVRHALALLRVMQR
jgi:hypothetical protein